MPKKGKKKDAAAEREAEEARRLAEEDRIREEERLRKERDANESKYRDHLANFFLQDMPRIKNQTIDFVSILENRAKQLEIDMTEKNNDKEVGNIERKWDRYLECSVLPSPKIERDLNTYLILWSEEALQFDEVPSLSTMYSQLPNALNLLKQLETERAELLDKESFEKASQMQSYMVDLLNILTKKWDHTTQQILQHVDLYARETAENFQIEGEQDGFKFGLWANLTKNPRHKLVEFPNTSMSCTVAKPLALDNVGMRMIYCADSSIGASFEVQEGTQRMSHIGGVLFFDLMELPESPKKIEKWIIRPIMSTNGTIKRLEYPFKKSAEVEDEDQEAVQDTAIWLIQVNYVMQPNCVIDKSASIMFWDAAKKSWSKDGIKDEDVDHENGRVTFRTMKFAPYALCQNTYLELPYKDWEMSAGKTECILRITGQANEIKVLIKEGTCQLIGPLVELHTSLQSPCSPSLFFKRLSHIGLNFFGPKSMNGFDVGDWVAKHSKAERGCIDGISCFVNRFSTRRSPFNGQLSFSKCVFQFQEVGTEEWKSVIYNTDYKIGEEIISTAIIPKSKQIDDETRVDLDGNESKNVNATVYHALCSGFNDEESIERPSTLLQQTVVEVLQITRVLAFS